MSRTIASPDTSADPSGGPIGDAVSGWVALSERFGKLPFEVLLDHRVALFLIDQRTARRLASERVQAIPITPMTAISRK